MKRKLKVQVDWCDHNYAACITDHVDGIVVVTEKTYDGLMKELSQALKLHIKSMDAAPEWLQQEDYDLSCSFTASASLQMALAYTTLAAISRVTGIRQAQLSHYANATSRPMEQQWGRIVSGLHQIGRACMAVQ